MSRLSLRLSSSCSPLLAPQSISIYSAAPPNRARQDGTDLGSPLQPHCDIPSGCRQPPSSQPVPSCTSHRDFDLGTGHAMQNTSSIPSFQTGVVDQDPARVSAKFRGLEAWSDARPRRRGRFGVCVDLGPAGGRWHTRLSAGLSRRRVRVALMEQPRGRNRLASRAHAPDCRHAAGRTIPCLQATASRQIN